MPSRYQFARFEWINKVTDVVLTNTAIPEYLASPVTWPPLHEFCETDVHFFSANLVNTGKSQKMVKDGEIVGLKGNSNGRNCAVHAVCGEHLALDELVRFRLYVVEVDGKAEEGI